MPRDSQRSKVYKAEQVADLQSARLETVAEMQDFVDTVTRSRWWKNRTDIEQVEVRPGRGCRRALATYDWITYQPVIKMPKWSRSKHNILHELCHHLTLEEYAAHGREFCRNYLEMVKRWLGREQWESLHCAFRDLRVKHHKARNLSAESRAALAAAAKQRFRR